MIPRDLVDKDDRSRKTHWCHIRNIGHPEDGNRMLLRYIVPYLPNYTDKCKVEFTPELATKALWVIEV